MEENLNDIELIESYLSNQLDSQESTDFEQRLTDDRAFKELFEARNILIKELKVDAFKDDLSAYMKSKQPVKQFRLSQYWISGIAASLILVSFIVYLLMPGENLFESHFQPYPNTISSRADGNQSEAMYHYSVGNYAEAIQLFENQEVIKEKEKLYLGISYLAIDKVDKAISIFTTQLSSERAPYARWYLALCILKKEDHEKAIS